MDADFDQLHVIVPLILALLLVLVAIAGFAVCIKRSKKAFSDLPFYIITYTVFPHIVSAETIIF